MTVVSMTTDQFTEAVRQAAQQVAAVHRKRLVLYGFVAGLLATAIICLPVVWLTAKANCNAITTLAKASEHRFIESKNSSRLFLTLSKDRFGLTEDQFQALVRRGETAQQQEIDATNRVARRDCAVL